MRTKAAALPTIPFQLLSPMAYGCRSQTSLMALFMPTLTARLTSFTKSFPQPILQRLRRCPIGTFMKSNIAILVLSILSTAICMGQSTNLSGAIPREWGAPISGVRLSVTLTNTIIPVGSGFSVFADVENTSTNIVFIGDSGPTLDFSVSLVDKTGRTYQITKTPFNLTRRISLKLPPGATVGWTIPVGCDRYYQAPGYIPIKKDVPSGDYVLKATRMFSPRDLESNFVRVKIK